MKRTIIDASQLELNRKSGINQARYESCKRWT